MHSTKAKAEARIEEIRQSMHRPNTWEKAVWEGMTHWHCKISRGPIEIYETREGNFVPYMSTDGNGGNDPVWELSGKFYKTPQKAVNAIIKVADKKLSFLKSVLYWARTGNMSNTCRIGLGREPIQPLPKGK